jgi:hypothetical protein
VEIVGNEKAVKYMCAMMLHMAIARVLAVTDGEEWVV